MSRVPDYLDPWRAVDQERCLEGGIVLNRMRRLQDLLVDSEGEARFELEFFRDHKGRPCVRGRVTATLLLICQRCMEPMSLQVKAPLLLGLVQGVEEAEQLPEEYDPWLVEEGRVQPQSLIEDELILALPQVPMHPSTEVCIAGSLDQAPRDAHTAKPTGDETENPFQVLAQLKKQLH